MAAEGMQFSWRRNGGTISLNLGDIWEMSVNQVVEGGPDKTRAMTIRSAFWTRVLSRHFPDNPQIQGKRTTVPPPGEPHPFPSHPMA